MPLLMVSGTAADSVWQTQHTQVSNTLSSLTVWGHMPWMASVGCVGCQALKVDAVQYSGHLCCVLLCCRLQSEGIALLGAIPEDQLLRAVRLDEVQTALDAEFSFGSKVQLDQVRHTALPHATCAWPRPRPDLQVPSSTCG